MAVLRQSISTYEKKDSARKQNRKVNWLQVKNFQERYDYKKGSNIKIIFEERKKNKI